MMAEGKEGGRGVGPGNPEWKSEFSPGPPEEFLKRFQEPKMSTEEQEPDEREISEEERRAWQYHERAQRSPEITRILTLPYPESARLETRRLIEEMVQTPATLYDRYGWMRDANAVRERARVLERGRSGKKESSLGKILRFEEIPDSSTNLIPEPQGLEPLTPYEKARLKKEEVEKIDQEREKKRKAYEDRKAKYEVLRESLIEELDSLGSEFAAVVRMAQAYSNHWVGSVGELAESYVRTPREMLVRADDLNAIFNAPPLIFKQPLDAEGKPIRLEEGGEAVYPIDDNLEVEALTELRGLREMSEGAKENARASLGHNIDKVMRLCLLISLSEDGEKLRKWKKKTIDNSTRIIQERKNTIHSQREEKGRELLLHEREEISKLDKVLERIKGGDKETYWRYLFGIEDKQEWEMWIGSEDQLWERKKRKSEKDVYEENRLGIRGKLLRQGNIWSLPRRGEDKEELRKDLLEIMGEDELAVDLGMIMHVAFGTMAQFGTAHYDYDKPAGQFTESSVEGFPYMTEDVRLYNFDMWQIYKGQAAGPHGNEEKKVYYGPLAVSLLKYTTTFERDKNGAEVYISEDGTKYAEYSVRDKEGNVVSAYFRLNKGGSKDESAAYFKGDKVPDVELESPRRLDVDLTKTTVSFFDLWQEGKRIGDLPWGETVEDPRRVWMLRIFFAGREGGLLKLLTRDDWKYEELMTAYFWEGFKLTTKVNIKPQLINEPDGFWEREVLERTTDIQWQEAAKRADVKESDVGKLKENEKVRAQRVKDYIYKTWWEGIKKLPQYRSWLIPSVPTMKKKLVSEEVDKEAPAELIVKLAKKHGIDLGGIK